MALEDMLQSRLACRVAFDRMLALGLLGSVLADLFRRELSVAHVDLLTKNCLLRDFLRLELS